MEMTSRKQTGANFCTTWESNLPIDGARFGKGYKDLTSLLLTCANMQSISWFHMTRQHQRGFQNTLPEFRKPFLCAFHPASAKLESAFVLIATCILVLAPLGTAQTSDVDDIHVQPRISSDAISKTNIDSALSDTVRPHAPTIKSKVDLVLVPVTVTDPANRLVTGLDKAAAP